MQDKQQLMQDLLFKGFVEREELVHGVKFVIKNINSEDQLLIEQEMSGTKGSSSFLVHTYQKKVLTFTLISVGEIKFKNREEILDWLKTQSSTIINLLIKKQAELEKELATLVGTLKGEDVEDFSETLESTKD